MNNLVSIRENTNESLVKMDDGYDSALERSSNTYISENNNNNNINCNDIIVNKVDIEEYIVKEMKKGYCFYLNPNP